MTFYHPKYYAALRAERRKLQAASTKLQASSSKQQEPRPASAELQAPSSKLQAPSCKRQAPSWYKKSLIASSPKQNGSRSRPEVSSAKIPEPGYKWKRFVDLGPRAWTKINVFLGCTKCHEIWCGENRIFLPFVTFSSTVKNVPELLYPNRSGMPGMARFSILFQIILGVLDFNFLYNFCSAPTNF